MTKTIRHVSELPDWFDIRNYEQWHDEDPNQAASAVENRLSTAWLLYIICVVGKKYQNGYVISGETIEKAHGLLAQSSTKPYDIRANDMLMEILSYEDVALNGIEQADAYRRELEGTRKMDDLAKKEILRIFGDNLPIINETGLRQVSLWDVQNWMEENKELLSEIKKTAVRLAEDNGWDIEEVYSSLSSIVPIWSTVDSSDFVVLNDYPTIPAVLQRIEEHLKNQPFRNSDISHVRYSEVRKLFDYRIAAYADLTAWSHLISCTITKKCMANALFPDGRYGELDMQPSKTVGRFIKRLEEGYIKDLVAKSAEMKSMQF